MTAGGPKGSPVLFAVLCDRRQVVGRNSEAYCADATVAACRIIVVRSFPAGAGFSQSIFWIGGKRC
jgi:hypothetical protein